MSETESIRGQGLPVIHAASMVRFDPVQVRAWLNRGHSTDASAREIPALG
jgi:hypothetical protein